MPRHCWSLAAVFLLLLGLSFAGITKEEPKQTKGDEDKRVSIRICADQLGHEVKPVWRFFGYDEANYTYAPDGKKLLADIATLKPQPAHIRTHHLLTSGDGTAWLKWSSTGIYKEDEKGQPVYNWEIVDRIFDTFREHKLKPFVELGFMPEALSSKPDPYAIPRVTEGPPKDALKGGWTYPPKDYAKWEGLIEAWAKHCAERYGREEAESWFWELWNEPNIAYWKGTPDEYNKLYDHTVAALKRALPRARVGGPHVTGAGDAGAEKFLRQYLDHCLRGENAATGKTGTPLDFIAFHAKGGTANVESHVRMNLGNHLRHIDRGFAIISSYPELKDKPILIGESDPDGCAACSARFFPQNGYRNGTQYASYTAATFMRKLDLAQRHGVNFEGAVTWAFEFEEQPWFDGFRVLSTNGVVLPVFNTFRMFSLLEKSRLVLDNPSAKDLDTLIRESVRKEADVHAFATRGERALSVLVWHYHDDAVAGPDAAVELAIQGIDTAGKQARLVHYRIDDEHSNAYAAWKKIGSPQKPSPQQREALQKASQLEVLERPKPVDVRDGRFLLRFTMPRQSVSLIRIEW
jgi:xylan 1,4-beta-xylosidase